MSKFKAILAGLIPIVVIIFGGIYFYSQFPNTPALILLLLFAFSAVLFGITLYNNVLEHEETKHIPFFEWKNIEIERNLLPIFPDEFFATPQIADGTLWCFGEMIGNEIIRYQSGNINKLKNESVFEFSQGYNITVKDVHFVNVGDFQFSVSSVESLIIKKNNQLLHSIVKRRNIVTIEKNGAQKSYKIDTDTPLFVFVLNEDDEA
jgi:hypothetical protein